MADRCGVRMNFADKEYCAGQIRLEVKSAVHGISRLVVL